MLYTLGVDIGSSSCKAVVLANGRDIIASAAVQSGTGPSGPSRLMEEIYAASDL